jgi:hypothetical protein
VPIATDAPHGCRASASQPPVPFGGGASSIWRTAEDVYLTIGTGLYHSDGKTWSQIPLDCGCGALTGVYGTGPSDIHVSAFYGGTSFHFDGSSWQKDPVTDMNAVWDSDPDCVVMVGGEPAQISHFQNGQWVRDPIPSGVGGRNLSGVWGSDDKNILAVGEAGLILRHSVSMRGWGEEPAGNWALEGSGVEVRLRAVWGSGPTDVFIVGDQGTILHYDGELWTRMTSGTTADLSGVNGTARDDVFAVGAKGTILHFDGVAWTALQSGTTNDVYAVSPSSKGRATVVSSGALLDCTP